MWCHYDNIYICIIQANEICFIFRNEYQQVTVSVTVVFCCAEYEKKTNETCQSKFNSSE